MTELLYKQFGFAEDIARLIVYAFGKGYSLTFGEAFRPLFVQEIYFKEGKTQTLHSQHLERLAVDFNLFLQGRHISTDAPEWHILGTYWKSLNVDNRWGGDFPYLKDYNHFETLG